MLDALTIVETQARPAAVIKLKIPKAEIAKVMGPAMQELMALIPSGAITPTGPIFSHHFKTEPASWEFEVGIPVTGTVKGAGRVVAGSLPAKRVIRTIYRGGYEQLGAAWGEFTELVKARSQPTTGEFWEIYLTGPETDPDPKRWTTELAMVLA